MLTEYQAQRFYKHVEDGERIDLRIKYLQELMHKQVQLLTWIAKCMCPQIPFTAMNRAELTRELRTITGDETL